MSAENIAAGVLIVALIGYAVFGGADFGGGVWVAFASGPRKAMQREALMRAIGPVWETNHVWLVLVVVTLFTAFPRAFADLFTALMVPLVIALIGICSRGAAFAFRHFAAEIGESVPATGAVFSVASITTPAIMGLALGIVSGGQVEIREGTVVSGFWEPLFHPFPILCALIGVTMCAFLAACYMTTRTTGELREDFRRRGLVASLALGALTALMVPVSRWDAVPFWEGMTKASTLALLACGVAVGLTSLAVLWRRRYVVVPAVAALTVALVIAAWGVAQYPYFILPGERIADVAASPATLRLFLITLLIGAFVVVPSLALLFLTFNERTDAEPAA